MKPDKLLRSIKTHTAAAALFWLICWQAAATLLHQPLLLSSPIRVLQRLFILMRDPNYYRALGYSLSRIALGFLLGTALGSLLSAAAVRMKWLEILLRPLMITVRTVPVASFIILALVFLTSRKLNTFISVLMVLAIVYVSLLEGLKGKSRPMEEMAQLYRISRLRRVLYIDLPQLKPCIISALSLAWGMSWKSGVAAEVIGIPSGSTGEMLYRAKVYLETDALYAWTLSIVLVSLLAEKCILSGIGRAYARMERKW